MNVKESVINQLALVRQRLAKDQFLTRAAIDELDKTLNDIIIQLASESENDSFSIGGISRADVRCNLMNLYDGTDSDFGELDSEMAKDMTFEDLPVDGSERLRTWLRFVDVMDNETLRAIAEESADMVVNLNYWDSIELAFQRVFNKRFGQRYLLDVKLKDSLGDLARLRDANRDLPEAFLSKFSDHPALIWDPYVTADDGTIKKLSEALLVSGHQTSGDWLRSLIETYERPFGA